MNKEEEKGLSYNSLLTNTCGRCGRIRKSPFGNHHSYNQCRQETSIEANANENEQNEEWDFIVSKYQSTKYL